MSAGDRMERGQKLYALIFAFFFFDLLVLLLGSLVHGLLLLYVFYPIKKITPLLWCVDLGRCRVDKWKSQFSWLLSLNNLLLLRPSARVAVSGVCPHPCQGDAQKNFHFVHDALFASGFRSSFLFH